MNKIAWFTTALLTAFAAHHVIAAPIAGKSAFVNERTLLVQTQGFEIELGVSNALIYRSLARKGYTDIKITKRKLTKARAEACRKGKRYVVEIKFDGDVKPIKKIGDCQSRVNADAARKKLKKKGYRQIQLFQHGDGFVAAACRDKRRFRLSINEYGEVRKKAVLGRCGTVVTQYDLAALLRAQGYSRVRVERTRGGEYSVDACRQDNRVKLIVSKFGVIEREKSIGRCDPPIHPAVIPAILARYGFSRIDVIDRTLPRYVAHACRDTQRVAISMNRFGEIMDEESIGRCDPPLSTDGLRAMLRRVGYDKVRNVRDTPSGYVAEVCEDGLRLQLELTRYGETINQKTVGNCQSRRVRRVIESLEKDGVQGASLYVDGCVGRKRVRIKIDKFGNPGRRIVIGKCR